MELWDTYSDTLRSSLKADEDGSAATEFYQANRDEMDKGAQVSWPERYRDDELSGLQHAMNLKIRNEEAFYAECQNEPQAATSDMELSSVARTCAKTHGHKRGIVPADCSVLTAFTDVQKEHLFWMVCAWTPDFSGAVIDYGAWPDQKLNYFTRRGIRHKLSKKYAGDDGGIMHAALTDLGDKLAADYKTADGRVLSISRWCIDGGWEARAEATVRYAQQSRHKNLITITKGYGVKASQNPFSEAQRAIKYRTGPGWFWQDGPGNARWVTFDANLWKKRVHEALCLEIGERGSLTLFQGELKDTHLMLAEHTLAEKPIKNEARGRTVYEFDEIPGRDNEGLDNLVGCFVGASICGITRDSERRPTRPAKKRKVSYL